MFLLDYGRHAHKSFCSTVTSCIANRMRHILYNKSCADTFSILISHLANLSFTQATFPSKFKPALISLLVKKPGLPKSDLANFRSLSNLNTIGKIIERLALSRFFLTFQNLPVFLLYNLLIVNFILLRLLCLSSQIISWKTLIPEKLQFSRLWTCPQPLSLILWTTLLFFIDSSILSVYLAMLSHGFVRI